MANILRIGSQILRPFGGGGILRSIDSDIVPNQFTFTDQVNVALSSTITSDPVTITGLNSPSPITVSGGLYDINQSGVFTSSPGSVNNNDTVRARVTSSSSNSTAVDATVTIGGVSDTFTATTLPASGAFFEDDFSSGDFSKEEGGFGWDGATNCTVISGFSPQGTTGNCVRFNFGIGTGGISELRFHTGGTDQELWLRWYQYMPTGSESPTRGPAMLGSNINGNKFLRLFALPESNYPRFGGSWYNLSGTDVHIGPQAGIFADGSVSQVGPEFPFCNSANRGRWVKVEVRCKNSTSVGTPNGQIQYWIDDVSQGTVSNLNTLDGAGLSNTGFNAGYLMGAVDTQWDNSGTFTYVGDFAISRTGRA